MSRHIRWQATLALLGLFLIGALLSYATYSYTTVEIPARGGVFVEGVVGNPQYINPVLCQYNDVDRDLCVLVFNGLLRYDERGDLQPDLAERWEASPASNVFTFTLRADARWHDGLRMTAEDVIFTVELFQDPDLPVLPDLAGLWRSVIPSKVDERTVVFSLTQPYAAFPDYTTIRWFGVLPKHYWQRYRPGDLTQAQLNTQPIGSGPFRVTAVDSQHVRLEPVPQGFPTQPMLEAIEFRFFGDYTAILAAIERGEVQGISRVPPELLAQAEAMPNLQLFTSTLPGFAMILFNLTSPNAPFLAEPKVRQALAYGINRQHLLEEVIPGLGVPADSPILPGTWAYNPDIPTYPYDPARGRALLDEAGWVDTDGDGVREKNGVVMTMTLLSDDAPTSVQTIQAIADDWAALGVRAVPQAVSFAGLASDFLMTRNFMAALIVQEYLGDPDPYPLWHSTQLAPNGQNFTGWQNRQADIVMEQARITTDRHLRRQLYEEFQVLFAQDVPAIVLYYPLYVYGVSTAVKEVEIGRLNEPADRFRTFPRWYMLTEKMTRVERRTLELDKWPE